MISCDPSPSAIPVHKQDIEEQSRKGKRAQELWTPGSGNISPHCIGAGHQGEWEHSGRLSLLPLVSTDGHSQSVPLKLNTESVVKRFTCNRKVAREAGVEQRPLHRRKGSPPSTQMIGHTWKLALSASLLPMEAQT